MCVYVRVCACGVGSVCYTMHSTHKSFNNNTNNVYMRTEFIILTDLKICLFVYFKTVNLFLKTLNFKNFLKGGVLTVFFKRKNSPIHTRTQDNHTQKEPTTLPTYPHPHTQRHRTHTATHTNYHSPNGTQYSLVNTQRHKHIHTDAHETNCDEHILCIIHNILCITQMHTRAHTHIHTHTQTQINKQTANTYTHYY